MRMICVLPAKFPCTVVSVVLLKRRAYELFSGAGKSEARNGDRPEDFELILSDPLLKDGLMCWPLWRANTVGFMPCTFSPVLFHSLL